MNSPPAPCLDLTAISSAISLGNLIVSSPFERASDTFDVLLEGSSLVPELSDLIQKDPDLAGKCLGEIVDISALGGSAGRREIWDRKTDFGGAPLAL